MSLSNNDSSDDISSLKLKQSQRRRKRFISSSDDQDKADFRIKKIILRVGRGEGGLMSFSSKTMISFFITSHP